MKEVTDKTFGLLRQLLYSFPPPLQKKCSLPKLLHTYKWPDEQLTSLLSINPQTTFRCLIVLLLWGSSTVERSAGGQDTTVQEQNQTKQHLHKDYLDIIQQIFVFFFLM